jgi:hypothetical protein
MLVGEKVIAIVFCTTDPIDNEAVPEKVKLPVNGPTACVVGPVSKLVDVAVNVVEPVVVVG